LLGLVQMVIKNPTRAAAVKTNLLGVADDIYAAYGVAIPPASSFIRLGLTQPGKKVQFYPPATKGQK
jgi:hypothetical protein